MSGDLDKGGVGGGEERGERRLVGGFHVSFVRIDDAFFHKGHQGLVHRVHAFGRTTFYQLTDVGNLSRANRVRQGFVWE